MLSRLQAIKVSGLAWEVFKVVDEVYAADLLFEDVEFIKEEDKGGVGETVVVLDSSKHLDRLHQFVFPFLKQTRVSPLLTWFSPTWLFPVTM